MENTQLEKKIETDKEASEALVIKDDATFVQAQNLMVNLKGRSEEINEAFDAGIKDAHKLHKGLLATKKKYSDPVATALATIKQKVCEYGVEQNRIANEERIKKEAELKAQEDEDKLAEADELQDQGRHEEAEMVLDRPSEVAPVVMQTAPKVAGVSYKTTWGYKIINASLIPREYMQVDEKAIGSIVRALKAKTSIPGIEVYSNKNVSVSAK